MEFYVVEGQETGCNSLRPPVTLSPTSTTQVTVKPLDQWSTECQVEHADLIKLDVEGGEREFLQGAQRFLTGSKRPVILAEVQDIRTRPWGYGAREIIEHLCQRNFIWFRVSSGGCLEELDSRAEEYDGNFVAIPQELVRLAQDETKGQKC